MKRFYYNDLDSGSTYFLALVVPLAFGLILTIILGLIGNSFGYLDFRVSPVLYTIYLSLVSLSFLGVFFIFNKVKKIDFKKASLFKIKFGWVNLAICVVIAFVTLFGFNSIINYLFYLLEQVGYRPDTSLPLPLTNGWWLALNLFVLAVIPAICEELIYRGIILNGFRKFGKVSAILLSALFFSLSHGSAMQFIYQFILGVVLAYVVIKTGSIIASMVVHFLNNATVVVYNYIIPNQTTGTFTASSIITSFVLAIASSGLLILLIYFLKEKKSVQISYNDEYNKLYSIKEKRFSSGQSRLIFWTALVISVVLWSAGTFFG